jgi:hypothetical protein
VNNARPADAPGATGPKSGSIPLSPEPVTDAYDLLYRRYRSTWDPVEKKAIRDEKRGTRIATECTRKGISSGKLSLEVSP